MTIFNGNKKLTRPICRQRIMQSSSFSGVLSKQKLEEFIKILCCIFRSWSCNAAAELRILNFKPETEPFTRSKSHSYRYLPLEKLCKAAASACQKSFFKYLVFHTIFSEIQHLFYSKENDWGFSTFIPWNVSCKYFLKCNPLCSTT